MHNLNVLIVDDSKAMLGIAEATLHEVGIEKCTCVQSGKDALSAIHHASPPFDLLFIDLNMPGMDGIELIRKLSTSRYEGAVVILSALDEKILLLAEQITSSLRIRLMGSISKPIDRPLQKTMAHHNHITVNKQIEDHALHLPNSVLTAEQIRDQ